MNSMKRGSNPRSRQSGHGHDVGLDQAFDRDDVELDLFESRGHRGVDAAQHAGQIVAPRDLAEALAVERIEVNVQPA